MTPLLIGLAGYKGSGKNTVGEFIAEWWDGKAELQGFADRMKLSFARQFVPDATMEEALEFADYFKEYGKLSADTPVSAELFYRFGFMNLTGRQAIQNYGMAIRNTFGADFWVDQLLPTSRQQDFLAWSPDSECLIITDVRLENEAQRILDLGGDVFYLENSRLDKTDDHVTEAGLDKEFITDWILNNSTLEQLRTDVFDMMDNYYANVAVA